MSVIHQPREPEIDVRMLLFPAAGAVLFSVLFFRLWYIQVVKSGELTERAEASRIQRVQRLAPRGLMVDRNGVLVAGVKSEIVVTAVPNEIEKHPEALAKVAALLGADRDKLMSKVKDGIWKPYVGTPIFVGATVAQGVKIAESAVDLPGIGVETQPTRYYPDSVSFTHVLGSVRVPTEKDVERIESMGVSPAKYVGRDGIERAYERQLMGTPGVESREIDAKGRPQRVIGRDAAMPGSELILTIDARLQRLATMLFREKGFKGAAVALDPRNGEVLCMSSAPTFDQNLFQGGISNAEWQSLQNAPGKPMLNRSIYASYSPGSTFKIVTTLAAYEKGNFNPRATVFCAGGYQLGRRFAKCLGHHGAVNYARALQVSCNTYFFTQGMRAGETRLRTAALQLGLGERTGIEVIGESRGIVPTEAWIQKHRDPPVWTGGDTLNMAIGQGELRCTPLQMANAVATVANNGVGYRPHLVRRIKASGTNTAEAVKPTVLCHVQEPPSYWKMVQDALVGVIEGGTARSAQIPGLRWGGKTGSTEHAHSKKTHAWFVGFAPAENPKIAIAVLVEDAGHGGSVAAPIAKELVQTYLSEASASPNPSASASTRLASADRPSRR